MSPILQEIPGLLCHWDFNEYNALVSKGTAACVLNNNLSTTNTTDKGMAGSKAFILSARQKLALSKDQLYGKGPVGTRELCTVSSWIKFSFTEQKNSSHPSDKINIREWAFVTLIFGGEKTIHFLNGKRSDEIAWLPIHIPKASGQTIPEQPVLHLEIPLFLKDRYVCMLSGLTIYNRSLSAHEINLLYHHML